MPITYVRYYIFITDMRDNFISVSTISFDRNKFRIDNDIFKSNNSLSCLGCLPYMINYRVSKFSANFSCTNFLKFVVICKP